MLMSLRDVARLLNVSVMRIEYSTKKGAIPAWRKWNGKRYYDAEQVAVIRAYFEAREPWDAVVPKEAK